MWIVTTYTNTSSCDIVTFYIKKSELGTMINYNFILCVIFLLFLKSYKQISIFRLDWNAKHFLIKGMDYDLTLISRTKNVSYSVLYIFSKFWPAFLSHQVHKRVTCMRPIYVFLHAPEWKACNLRKHLFGEQLSKVVSTHRYICRH